MKALLLQLLILPFMFGCTSIESLFEEKGETQILQKEEFTNLSKEYENFLISLEHSFLKNSGTKTVRLRNSNQRYLKSLYRKIFRNNEYFLEREVNFKVVTVDDGSTFYFSLPNGTMFLSKGLIKKYLKNEDLLAAVISSEVIRMSLKLYVKRLQVPLGYITTERLIGLTSLPIDVTKNINNWTYNVLKRSGYDASVVLNWIQLKNRNSLDFSMVYREMSHLSREEFAFKNYLIKVEKGQSIDTLKQRNSSKSFYRFIEAINNHES